MPRPPFSHLPLRPSDPPYSAWGLYGPTDQLGSLNPLIPAVVQAAVREVRTGIRIGLDSPVGYLAPPSHTRLALKHTIIGKAPATFHDDTIELNTQWDGLRHYGYQKEKKFCNGVTVAEISGPDAGDALGMHCAQKKPYELLSDHAISVDELKAVAEAQGVEIREGDILIVRSGFNVGYEALSAEQKVEWSKAKPTRWVGLEASLEMARWLWDSGFSAAAGDAPGFERFPFGGVIEGEKLALHEIMLGGWGMPIGEMFNVEELSEECAR